MSNIAFSNYSLKTAYIQAVEVTPALVASLPNAGAALQRFGEQVEIHHGGPRQTKSYAQVGDYIAKFADSNGNDSYVVLAGAAFRGLMVDYLGTTLASDQVFDETTDEAAGPLLETAEHSDPVELPVESTEAKTKREKKEKRLKELQEKDIDVKEADTELDTSF